MRLGARSGVDGWASVRWHGSSGCAAVVLPARSRGSGSHCPRWLNSLPGEAHRYCSGRLR
jgi:hypothetical protein